jgi:hypothetical protein
MRRALQFLRLVVCLTVFPAGFAFPGGAAAVDSGGNVAVGLVAGALVGVFFGLVFSGYNFKWFDAAFGPEQDGDENPDGTPTPSPAARSPPPTARCSPRERRVAWPPPLQSATLLCTPSTPRRRSG